MQEVKSRRTAGTFQRDGAYFGLAHITHWLADSASGKLMRIPHSTRAPLEGRVWYQYPGQSPGGTTPPTESYIGTSSKPMKSGRVVDDNTTQLYQFVHNGLGRVEQLTDPVGRKTRFVYDANNRLVAIKQVNGAGEGRSRDI
jgi:YD repeat-containing protein